MKRIIFVCHGNICRSVAAEYIAKRFSDKYEFISRATSYEESGNYIYPPMKQALFNAGIPFSHHHATRISNDDYNSADYIFFMDSENEYYLNKMFPNSKKIFPIYKFTPGIKEIGDPWYDGRFSLVVYQLKECIRDILANLD